MVVGKNGLMTIINMEQQKLLELKVTVDKTVKNGITYYIGKKAKLELVIYDVQDAYYDVVYLLDQDWTMKDLSISIVKSCGKCDDKPAKVRITNISLLDVN